MKDGGGWTPSTGSTNDITTWTMPPSCAAVVQLVPFEGTSPTFGAMELAPVGPGTCAIGVAELGLEGALAMTVT